MQKKTRQVKRENVVDEAIGALLSRKEAAAHLGISTKTLDVWASKGIITQWKKGPRFVFYDQHELDNVWKQRQRH